MKAFKQPTPPAGTPAIDEPARAAEQSRPQRSGPRQSLPTKARHRQSRTLPVPEVQPTPFAEAQPAVPPTPFAAVRPPRKQAAGAKEAKPAVKTGPSKRGRKSLKQATAEADLIEIPADEVLFGKQYYTMGEVSAMFKVNQSSCVTGRPSSTPAAPQEQKGRPLFPAGRYQEPASDLPFAAAKEIYDRRRQGFPAQQQKGE